MTLKYLLRTTTDMFFLFRDFLALGFRVFQIGLDTLNILMGQKLYFSLLLSILIIDMYTTNKMTAMSNISSSSTRYNNNNNNNNRYSDGGRNKPMNGHSTVTAMKMKMKKKKGNKRNPDCSHKRMQRNQSLVFMKSSSDYYDNASLFIDRESDGNNSSKKRKSGSGRRERDENESAWKK